MNRTYAEPAFDVLIAIATAFALSTYLLGLFIDPTPAIFISMGVIILGTFLFAPPHQRVIAGSSGLFAVILAGVAIPRYVVTLTGIPDELPLTLALSVVVLVLTFVALRITTFHQRNAQPV